MLGGVVLCVRYRLNLFKKGAFKKKKKQKCKH